MNPTIENARQLQKDIEQSISTWLVAIEKANDLKFDRIQAYALDEGQGFDVDVTLDYLETSKEVSDNAD